MIQPCAPLIRPPSRSPLLEDHFRLEHLCLPISWRTHSCVQRSHSCERVRRPYTGAFLWGGLSGVPSGSADCQSAFLTRLKSFPSALPAPNFHGQKRPHPPPSPNPTTEAICHKTQPPIVILLSVIRKTPTSERFCRRARLTENRRTGK
jgi:hypothetical protein